MWTISVWSATLVGCWHATRMLSFTKLRELLEILVSGHFYIATYHKYYLTWSSPWWMRRLFFRAQKGSSRIQFGYKTKTMSTRVTSGTQYILSWGSGHHLPPFCVRRCPSQEQEKSGKQLSKHQNAFQLCGVYLFIGVGLMLWEAGSILCSPTW